ncbi:MAG: acetate--CoA ligase family protein [Gammaproteobacteria bacterium]|nr:acetate--CoA ligase family protein [Gammaproteobacteria bacterium]MDE0260718.1 acetate--CoA ligase family protein [Gammaproteobacteria bacterium]
MTLRRIFEPASIAVVGASANPTKRGYQILRGLAKSGYPGPVYAVNPRGGRLLGHVLLTSVEALPAGVDLAVLCTPARMAPALVRACGERGVGGVVVLAVGFGESGSRGTELEARLGEAAHAHGVRVIGPNTSGMMNLHQAVNLIGVRGVRAGGIALLVQSGNIALGLMNEIGARTREGVSVCCGLGNQVDVGFDEVLEYLGEDAHTKAVIAHVEGFTDARAFLRAAARVTPRKPVVVIKSGRTAVGARAALSHTGAVAGPYDRLRAGLAQAGVTEVRRTDQLVAVAHALASQPAAPPGSGIAILSDGGGQNTLAVDSITESRARLATLAHETRDRLTEVLGPAAAVANPVDVAGAADTDPGAFARALDVLAPDPAVGIVLVVGLFGGYGIRFSDTLTASETEAARAMAARMRALGKVMVVHSMYTTHDSPPLEAFVDAGIPVIESLEAACRAAVELERRSRRARAHRWDPEGHLGGIGPISPHLAIRAAREEGRITLIEVEARALLEAAGLAFPAAEVADSGHAAARAAERLGCPVAVKLLSRRITHKSDAGGVVLDVADGAAAARAFEAIVSNAHAHARAEGLPPEAWSVLVTPMLPAPTAELLIGAYRDPQLGPMLTVGIGGTRVEVLRDVTHRVLPIQPRDVEMMIGELRARPLLDGTRGHPRVCLAGIIQAAESVARCIMEWSDVAEVEVNPLFAYADRAVPADARVVLSPP